MKLQFSLRIMFIASAIIAISSFYVGGIVLQCKKQAEIVERVNSLGGKVYYCSAIKPPMWIKELEQCFGVLVSNFVVEVDLSGTSVQDHDLNQLVGLQELYFLDLSNTEISDEGLETVQSIQSLCILDLTSTCVTDVGLQNICKLPRMYRLTVAGTQISEACVDRMRIAYPRLDIVP